MEIYLIALNGGNYAREAYTVRPSRWSEMKEKNHLRDNYLGFLTGEITLTISSLRSFIVGAANYYLLIFLLIISQMLLKV